jgi:tetratricopeptide (TPR) repeat protein
LFFGYRPILPMAGLMLVLARVMILIATRVSRKPSPTGINAAVATCMCAAAAYLAVIDHSIASRWTPLWIWEHSFNALPTYSSRVEISPYLDVMLNYGIELTKSSDYSAAVEVLEKAAEIPTAAGNRKKTRVFYNLGNALIMMGNREEAIERFSQAIQESPRWAPPYNILGSLVLDGGDIPAALKNFRTAVDLDPSLPIYHYSLGSALLLTGENELAAQSLQKALELKGDYPLASAKLGKALLNLDKPKDAVRHLKTAVGAFPNHAELHSSLATAYEKLGMIQEAAQHLKHVLAIDPSHQEAKRRLERMLPEPSRERGGVVP